MTHKKDTPKSSPCVYIPEKLNEPYIETYTGEKFWFLNPTPEQIHLKDIAHALSMQCRFTGHTKEFYSVAEHSIAVSKLCPDMALAALMHDASEAYLTDVASPVKTYLANYKEMENKIMEAISKKFNFAWPLPNKIHIADKIQLSIEAKHLIHSGGKGWNDTIDSSKGVIPKCYKPNIAEYEFIKTFNSLLYHNEVNYG